MLVHGLVIEWNIYNDQNNGEHCLVQEHGFRSSPFVKKMAISISIHKNMTCEKLRYQWFRFISHTYR
jgi:hypothetical protein